MGKALAFSAHYFTLACDSTSNWRAIPRAIVNIACNHDILVEPTCSACVCMHYMQYNATLAACMIRCWPIRAILHNRPPTVHPRNGTSTKKGKSMSSFQTLNQFQINAHIGNIAAIIPPSSTSPHVSSNTMGITLDGQMQCEQCLHLDEDECLPRVCLSLNIVNAIIGVALLVFGMYKVRPWTSFGTSFEGRLSRLQSIGILSPFLLCAC